MKKAPNFIGTYVFFIMLVYLTLPKDSRAYDIQKLTEACKKHNGYWLAQYKECETADQDWCRSEEGQYEECSSACRHNPDPTAACTLQCVPICKFGTRSEREAITGADPKNTSYSIEDEQITLTDGYAEKAVVPGSATKIKTSVFAQSPTGDLDGDGLEDVAVILVQDPGGSGTFYYVAAAIKTGSGYNGTNSVFIGDRISLQSSEIRDREIVVNYADRFPWDSFAVLPSINKSKYLIYDGNLKEIPREILSQETAKRLIVENWGDCSPSECSAFTVHVIDGKDGTWYAEAIYDGLYDDSVKTEKRIASIHYVNGEWTIGSELVKEYKCQEGRGHQEFSSELCI